MNLDNRWVKMADLVSWNVFEKNTDGLFKGKTGNVAKPLQMALGSLIIQTKLHYSDGKLIEQITESPYLQYLISLPGYQEKAPFDASLLVLFRKMISLNMLTAVNDYLVRNKVKAETPIHNFYYRKLMFKKFTVSHNTSVSTLPSSSISQPTRPS